MKQEKICSVCGAPMKKRTWGGEIISSELRNSQIIENPKKRAIPETYECVKCGNVE
jgi:predicted RNA-binding Zn-ribbon protein involved in translation (DUF1610 family)